MQHLRQLQEKIFDWVTSGAKFTKERQSNKFLIVIEIAEIEKLYDRMHNNMCNKHIAENYFTASQARTNYNVMRTLCGKKKSYRQRKIYTHMPYAFIWSVRRCKFKLNICAYAKDYHFFQHAWEPRASILILYFLCYVQI